MPDRAKDSYRQRNWAEVRRWCGKVIGISDDWNAVEQAHLRLALAEQKLSGAEGGRRAFQVSKGRVQDVIFRLTAVLRYIHVRTLCYILAQSAQLLFSQKRVYVRLLRVCHLP